MLFGLDSGTGKEMGVWRGIFVDGVGTWVGVAEALRASVDWSEKVLWETINRGQANYFRMSKGH